jgi:MFS family permease
MRTVQRSPAVGFWVVAFAFLVAMAFSAVPTPLYVLYQQRDGFSQFMITVVFATYALGVIASLFLAGHTSDWLGRRRVLLGGLVFEAAAGALFLVWRDLSGLLLARFVSGIGIGLVTATATAYVAELHAAARPAAGSTRAELVSTAANIGGIGLGSLVTGLLAQEVSGPLSVPFWIFEGLLVVAAIGVALSPETVALPDRRPAYRPQRIAVPAAARPRYAAALAAAFVAFAVLGLFSSLAPSFLAGTLHHRSHAIAGAAAFLAFGSAGITQTSLARVGGRRQLAIGLLLAVAGVAAVTVAVWLPSLALFLAGGAVAGGGAGVLFRGTVATVIAIAPPHKRGEALAGLFLACYTGVSLPIVALGLATQAWTPRACLLVFAAAVVTAFATLSRPLLRRVG